MRNRLVLALFALASLAGADRLITIPTARKFLDGTYRIETLRDFGDGGRAIDYLAVGFGGAWEAEARALERPNRDARVTGDLTYNVISPITGLSPGFAIGVQDVADQTRPGARAFLCSTLRNEFGNGNVPFDVTSGLTIGRQVRPYVGASVPVYSWLRFLAEQNGFQGQAALEATPARGLRLRLVGRSGSIAGSIGYTARF